MSIRKMLAAHPAAKGHVNEPLAEAVKHAMYAAVICTSCADACSGESMDMAQCVRTCMDCADICTAAARVAARQTGDDRQMTKALLMACIDACEICAAECDKHDNDHCRRCALMCRECADDCREAVATLN
jgi:hypothetical protein